MKIATMVPNIDIDRQPEVDDHLLLVPQGELAQRDGAQDHNQGEQDQVVEDFVPDVFAKGVARDRQNASHTASRSCD